MGGVKNIAFSGSLESCGAKLLFPLLQRCSPAQHGGQNNLITIVFVQLQSLTTTHLTHALKCLREKFVSQRKSTQHSHIATGKATLILETGLREEGCQKLVH